MPRELEVAGILFPTLLVAFHLAAVAFWLLDRKLARAGFYRFVWHPSLFRVSLLGALFGALGLAIYH
jgi:uncharacterized membrane protein YsdA (DUF1294 family)